jgi:hypothetical protein
MSHSGIDIFRLLDDPTLTSPFCASVIHPSNRQQQQQIQKTKFGNSAARDPKNERGVNGQFYCKNCGLNRTHTTSKCFFLNNQTQRMEKKNLTMDEEASKKSCPFSRRTFCKEVNTLARKVGKKKVLGLYAAALKRKQDKESKAKVAIRCAIEAEDSLSSKDSMLVNNLEKPIPRKSN